MAPPELPKMDIRLTRKVKVGDPRGFDMAEVSIGVQNITPETTEEDINALLDGPGAIAYKCIASRLKDKVKELRG